MFFDNGKILILMAAWNLSRTGTLSLCFFFLAWLDKTAVNDWKVCGSMVCMALYGAIRMTFNRSTFATTGARECIRRDSRQNQPVGALFRPGRHAMAIPFIR